MSDMIIKPQNLDELARMTKLVCASALTSKMSVEDAAVLIMTGMELGLSPMAAIRGIHVVKGKPVLSADLMSAVVQRRSDVCEYLTVTVMSPERATVITKRRGSPSQVEMTWTMEDARRAGITGNPTWKKFPAAMLKARVVAQLCRAVYPDLVLGLYTKDEITSGAEVDAQDLPDVDVVDAEIVEEIVEDAAPLTPMDDYDALIKEAQLTTPQQLNFKSIVEWRFEVTTLEEVPANKLKALNRKLRGMEPDKRRTYIIDTIATENGDGSEEQ